MKIFLLFLLPTLSVLIIAEIYLTVFNLVPRVDQSNGPLLFEKKENSYKLKKNVKSILFAGSHISSNEFGFRDQGMDRTKKGSKRVAVLGDSWGFGWGLKEEESLPKKIGERSGTEVLNFSVPGFNIKNYLYVLKKEIPQFYVDEVIVLLHLNDILELDSINREFKTEKNYKPKLLQFITRKIIIPIAEVLEIKNSASVRYFEKLYTINTQPYISYQQKIKALTEEVKRQNLSLKVFILPIPFLDNKKYLLSHINRQLEALLKSLGVFVVDLGPVYEGIKKSKVTISVYDAHPSQFAIDLLSKEIAKHL
jgi:hypothetical protein